MSKRTRPDWGAASVLPPRPLLRPPSRPLVPLVPIKDARHTTQDTPPLILRMSSSTSFSSNNLVDTLQPTSTIIDGAVINDLRPTSFLSIPRIPSPDKPLPIVPLFPPSLSSIDGSIRYSHSTFDSTLDSLSLREQTDTLPPTPTLSVKNISAGLFKRTHALLELIESERAYASSFALIRDVHLPVALGT